MVNHIFQPDLTIIGRDILLSTIKKTVNRPKHGMMNKRHFFSSNNHSHHTIVIFNRCKIIVFIENDFNKKSSIVVSNTVFL